MSIIDNFSSQPSPSLNQYDYIKFLTRSRVAWEYLRRNPDYCRARLISRAGQHNPIDLIDGTILLRTRRRFMRAEAWGLYMFCQSSPISA